MARIEIYTTPWCGYCARASSPTSAWTRASAPTASATWCWQSSPGPAPDGKADLRQLQGAGARPWIAGLNQRAAPLNESRRRGHLPTKVAGAVKRGSYFFIHI